MLQIMIEVLILRTALAQAHKLNIAHKLFYLIVSLFGYACKYSEGPGVVHTGYLYKCQIVQGFGTPVVIILREFKRTFGIRSCGIQISVMIAVRKLVQPVHLGTIARIGTRHR